MANDLNQCNFIGRLGADPDARFLPSGDPVVGFRIAVGWKSKDKEGAEWISISAFGKLAEICAEYLRKGARVFISGRLQTDEYEKDGVKQYRTKIIADKMQMLDTKADSPARDSVPASAPRQPAAPAAGNGFEGMDDDIPF